MSVSTDDLLSGLDNEEQTRREAALDPDASPSAVALLDPSTANLHLRTKRFVLQSLLEKAASVVPVKDIMPVLKNFQLELSEDLLRVVATDLELSVIATTDVVSVEPGAGGIAVFPAKKLLEIIRTADEGEMVIDVVDGKATITVGRARWELMLQRGDEYPVLPDVADVPFGEVDRVRLLGAIEAVKYACPTREARPTLAMIVVSAEGKVTACDGVRFQQALLEGWPREVGGEPLEIQIPIGAVDDLVKLLRTTDQNDIGVASTDNHLIFRVGRDHFIANKLTAEFPDVERTLLRPALQNQDVLTCDRAELVDAVRRVRINADSDSSSIALAVREGKIRVVTQDKFGNNASEEIDAGWTMAARTLVVNHQFLYQMLQMADSRSLTFKLGRDTRSRKSFLVLEDPATNSLGVINQMRSDFMDLSQFDD